MKNKVINITKVIKNNKRIKYITIVTVMLLFISIIGYSLSFFNRDKVNLIANIKVNDLAFNITTNSGTSDDRILHLQAGKTESFNIIITNLNKISTKYELLYEVCSDEKCTNKLNELPEDVEVGLNSSLTNEVSGTINGKKPVYVNLLTENKTENDYYIKLNLNAGYVWNDLALVNQFDIFSKMTSIIAYVDGIEVNNFPDSCDYTATITGYKNNKEIPLKEASVTCDESTTEWKISYIGSADKIKITFKYTPPKLVEYIAKLDKTENGLEIDNTNDSNLRYVGASPKNYLTFNDETWRIIGTFNVYNAETGKTEKLVKIIRNNPLGYYSWSDVTDTSVNDGYGINEWSQATLMTELNTDYLGATGTSGTTNWVHSTKAGTHGTALYDYSLNIKSDAVDKIAKTRWNLGAGTSNTNSALNMYNAERGTTHITNPTDGVTRQDYWDGKVALMYASDYGYASTDPSCRSNMASSLNGVYNCLNNNWLAVTRFTSTIYSSYCLTPLYLANSSISYKQSSVFYIETSGRLIYKSVAFADFIRPTLFLKSDFFITGGTGAANDPYRSSYNTFRDDSWETIASNVRAGKANKYNVGDEKELLIDDISYKLRVANNSTSGNCSSDGFSQTACGLVVEFVNVLDAKSMNSTDTNVGGWRDSEMRSYLNVDLLNTFPDELKNVIIDTKVISGHGSTEGEENFETTDKLYLLSAKEVWGVNGGTAYSKSRQLDYYADNNVTTSSNYELTIKKLFPSSTSYPWWLRDVGPNENNYFFYVHNTGKWYKYNASSKYGISPAFRIG